MWICICINTLIGLEKIGRISLGKCAYDVGIGEITALHLCCSGYTVAFISVKNQNSVQILVSWQKICCLFMY